MAELQKNNDSGMPAFLYLSNSHKCIGDAVSGERKTKKELIYELDVLRKRCAELEEEESSRLRTEQALRESEALFRSLTENSPYCIALHDKDLHYCYVNPSISRVVGLPQDEFIGKTVYEVGLPLEAANKIDIMLRSTLETGCAQDAELSYPSSKGPLFYAWRSVLIRR